MLLVLRSLFGVGAFFLKPDSMKDVKKYPVTNELINFITLHHINFTAIQLVDLIRSSGWDWMTTTALRYIKYEYRIIKQHQTAFTEQEKQFVRDNYLKMGDVDIAKLMPHRTFKSVHKLRRKTLNLHRDKVSLRKIREVGSQKALEGRKKKMDNGTFHNPNYRTVGEVYKTNHNNYWYIKPDKDPLHRVVLYHRWLWEKEMGKIPKGFKVRFKGDIPDKYEDITIDMLECVSNKEHAQLISKDMPDNYVIGRLQYKSKGIDKEDIPDSLIQLKRNELLLKRQLNNLKNVEQ